jgi:hypothetical protein
VCIQEALLLLRNADSRARGREGWGGGEELGDWCGQLQALQQEDWCVRMMRTAVTAVQRGTELVWADKVEIAAAALGGAMRTEGGAGEEMGLGGYAGYGVGVASLVETERAAHGRG